ncbi:hypothetical protein [Haliangium sp.]|uniref:hypothetical protein n=1 Tax=Haliangium sp. TaxID=2663208 RepID=UPI003D11157F
MTTPDNQTPRDGRAAVIPIDAHRHSRVRTGRGPVTEPDYLCSCASCGFSAAGTGAHG